MVDIFGERNTMSPMAEERTKRTRRKFSDEFKVGAVRLVLDEGQTVGAVARDLDLTESALRTWVEQPRANRTHGKSGLASAEREELQRLRKELRIAQEERDILKNESRALTSPTCGPETPWRTLTRRRPWPSAFW